MNRWPALRKGSGRWICSQTVGKSLADFTCSGSWCDWIKRQWKKWEIKTNTVHGALCDCEHLPHILFGSEKGTNWDPQKLIRCLNLELLNTTNMFCILLFFFVCVQKESRVDGFSLFFFLVFVILIGNSWSSVCGDIRHDVWPSHPLLLIISVSERQPCAGFDLLLLKKNGAVCQPSIWLMLRCMHTSI